MAGATTLPAAQKAIDAITDSGIRSILYAHLLAEGNHANEAFSADGLERLNRNIQSLNNGHPHQPIKKVRVYEQANKFSVGTNGQKATKYVEAAKGTNLFFVIYTDEKGTRGYASVPLNIIIELQKTHEKDWKTHLAARLKSEDTNLIPPTAKVLYVLSPGDLVYVPTEDEQKNGIRQLDRGRIYKTISCSEKSCFFLHYSIATIILQKKEFEAKNKMERALTGEMIKEVCIPVRVDLLGNIIKIG